VRKTLRVLVAALVITALAAPAFAIQADFRGFMQVRGFMMDDMSGDKDFVATGPADRGNKVNAVDMRLRLWTDAALHENVKVVFGIEVDTLWGRDDAGPAGKQVGTMGADAKAEIEIKHLFLDFNIPFASTNVKAGTQFFRLGGGFIIADDAAGLQVRYTPVQGQSLLLAWVKAREGEAWSDSMDSDYYHVQYDTDFSGWRISPYAGYWKQAVNEPVALAYGGTGDETYFLGVDLSGKIGPFALTATVVGNDWSIDAPAGVNSSGNGLAAIVKGTYAMGSTTLTAEVARYGDSDAPDGRFMSLRQGTATGGYHNFAEIITGGRWDGRNGGTRGAEIFTNNNLRGIDNPYIMNYQYAKLGAEHKFDDKHKLSAFYIYAEQAERDAAMAERVKFGHEIDAYYDYAISKGMTFSLGGGYLIADNRFSEGDNPWKLGTALTYQF
jgi:hypothetical protein